MGSIAQLYFSGYPIGNQMTNYLYEWIFKKSDKRIFQRKISERNELVWGVHEGEDYTETAYVFEASVETIIKRLEIMGYTLEVCRNDFDHRIREDIKELKKLSINAQYFDEWTEKSIGDFVKQQTEIYSKYGKFDEWMNAFKIIIHERLKSLDHYDKPQKIHNNELVNYMLSPPSAWLDDDEHPFEFQYPCLDFNMFSRVILHVCKPNELVQLDATDLVLGGWYDGFERLEDSIKPNTKFYEILSKSLSEIQSFLLTKNDSINEKLLAKLLYANTITAFEVYLSDTLIYAVTNSQPLIRRLLETDPELKKRKFEYSELFKKYDGIKDEVWEYLNNLLYHNLPKVKELYHSVLCVEFPDMSYLVEAIKIRHDIVHRNGKTKLGEEHQLDLEQVKELIEKIKAFVDGIDVKIKNVVYLEEDL